MEEFADADVPPARIGVHSLARDDDDPLVAARVRPQAERAVRIALADFAEDEVDAVELVSLGELRGPPR